jgi:lipopolysaccharide biosynthesis glycosyltransferase
VTRGVVVTAIDEQFFPALKALHNSILMHSSCTDLVCMTYGTDELAEKVERLGVGVRHNVDINAHLPLGEGTPEGCKPMYARLLVPMMFDNCAWFDADQIVQTNLTPLFNMKFPEVVAAVPDPHGAKRSVIGMDVEDTAALYTGVMLFNAPAWREQKITERCIELMNNSEGVLFRFVVQSVLNVVLAGNFHQLNMRWQGFANRHPIHAEQYAVLHWHGRKLKPWTHPSMPNADVWKRYA